jgi:hypothetical protein
MRRQTIVPRDLLRQVHEADLISGSLTGSPGRNMSEKLMGFGSGCLTVTLLREPAQQRHFLARLDLGEVKWTPKIKPLLRPKLILSTCFSSMLVVVRIEEVSMLTDPPRPALFLYVAGHEWEGHSFPIARLRLFHQPAQLASPSNSLHSAAMAFDTSTNQKPQASGSHHAISAMSFFVSKGGSVRSDRHDLLVGNRSPT